MLEELRTLFASDNMQIQADLMHVETRSLLNLTKHSTRMANSEKVPFILNWYPNSLTLNQSLVRMSLPDCASLRARPVTSKAGRSSSGAHVPENEACKFEVNQLVKVAWAELSEAAPLITRLLDRFNISQWDYIQLLNDVS